MSLILQPLMETFRIVDVHGRLIQLRLNWAQRQLQEIVEGKLRRGEPARLVVLKARQLGVSTWAQALCLSQALLRENFHALILAHLERSTQGLLSMSRTMWDEWEGKSGYQLVSRAANQLIWAHRSSIKVSTAGSDSAVGRGFTYQFVHGSEVAFWKRPEEAMAGVQQALHYVPGTVMVVESTANGIGNLFHRMWQKAQTDPRSFWVPVFFPWWKHPSYMYRGSRFLSVRDLDDDERALYRFLCDQGLSSAETLRRITWYRATLVNQLDADQAAMAAEFPTTPEEAFQSTGRNVFAARKLEGIFEPRTPMRGTLEMEGGQVRFVARDGGPLHVWSTPSPDRDFGWYAIGVDTSRSLHGDFSCAYTVNRRSGKPVAMLRARMEPHEFALLVYKLACWYNNALVAPEVSGVGAGEQVVGVLLAEGYTNLYRHRKEIRINGVPGLQYGWVTTQSSKHEAIAHLVRVVDEASKGLLSFKIFDRTTFNEMMHYVLDERGEYRNSGGVDHDDTVMALAIAMRVLWLERHSLPDWHEKPERRYLLDGVERVVGAELEASGTEESWLEGDFAAV